MPTNTPEAARALREDLIRWWRQHPFAVTDEMVANKVVELVTEMLVAPAAEREGGILVNAVANILGAVEWEDQHAVAEISSVLDCTLETATGLMAKAIGRFPGLKVKIVTPYAELIDAAITPTPQAEPSRREQIIAQMPPAEDLELLCEPQAAARWVDGPPPDDGNYYLCFTGGYELLRRVSDGRYFETSDHERTLIEVRRHWSATIPAYQPQTQEASK